MTLPPFPIAGGISVALARGFWVAGLFSVFGATLARQVTMRPALVGVGPAGVIALGRWRTLIGASLALAVLASATWTWLIAGTLAGAPGFASIAATAWILLGATSYGHIVLLQWTALALVVASLVRRLYWMAAGFAAIALALEATHGHAFAQDPGASWLLFAVMLHLLAGAAWLGGLLPLLISIQSLPVRQAALACHRFSPLGIVCVPVVAATAGFQFWMLIGALPLLLDTAYGLMALAKTVLFLILLGFGATNLLRLTPALAGGAPLHARQRMRRSLANETMIGLLVVLAAGVLASLPPSVEVAAMGAHPMAGMGGAHAHIQQ